jgi:flagellar protein FlaH
MANAILVIEHDLQLMEGIRGPTEDSGYLVLTARNGSEGLRKAKREQPSLVIVDFSLPDMTGNVVARRLRKDPATNHQVILMVAGEDQIDELEIGPRASADDFLIKPFAANELVGKIKTLIKSENEEKGTVIATGNSELDSKMGGGVPMGSLMLIEGDSGAGKSVLSQQMMHGCLKNGYQLTLFSSENTVKSLAKQMRSLNLNILDYVLLDKFRVFSIETSRLGTQAPTILMQAMKSERRRDIVFIDSLTSSITEASDTDVMTFFEECKRLCSNGTTVVVVVHSHGMARELIIRVRSLCDAHLQLHTEEVGQKLVKTLEVTKVRGAEQHTGNIISFEVEPGWGMRVIPINRVKG